MALGEISLMRRVLTLVRLFLSGVVPSSVISWIRMLSVLYSKKCRILIWEWSQMSLEVMRLVLGR